MTDWPEALVERCAAAAPDWEQMSNTARERHRERVRVALDASGLREAVKALEKISAHVPLEQAYDDVLGQRIGIARATLDRIKGAPND